jgi:hypothetical protein
MAFAPRLATSTIPPRPPASLSPERQELATAIEGWRTSRIELDAIDRAIATAFDATLVARAARDAAEADIGVAKDDAAAHLTAVALGTAGPAPRTIREARAALTDAQDAMAAAEAALAALKARHRAAADALGVREHRRERAARAVVLAAPETAVLLATVERLQRELVEKGAALVFLRDRNVLDVGMPGLPNYRGNTGADVALLRLESPISTWRGPHLGLDPAGARPWEVALSALLLDAAASLPSTHASDPPLPSAA